MVLVVVVCSSNGGQQWCSMAVVAFMLWFLVGGDGGQVEVVVFWLSFLAKKEFSDKKTFFWRLDTNEAMLSLIVNRWKQTY